MDNLLLRNKLIPAPSGREEDDFAPYLIPYLLRAAKTPLGAVVVIPGGGYRGRAQHEADAIARKFNELGFHAFVLHYRVYPYHFPAPQQDALRAIKLIRSRADEWFINQEQIAALGFSAGGHLAASIGTMHDKIDAAEGDQADAFSGRPDALLLAYAVLSSDGPFAHRNTTLNLLGENPDPQLLEAVNIYKCVNNDTPPAFLWSTADDQAVPVNNSIAFAQAMWQSGNTCELHVFSHGKHGYGLGISAPDIRQWPSLAATFLEHKLKFTRAHFTFAKKQISR